MKLCMKLLADRALWIQGPTADCLNQLLISNPKIKRKSSIKSRLYKYHKNQMHHEMNIKISIQMKIHYIHLFVCK